MTLCSLSSKTFSYAPADAARGTSDNRYFVFNFIVQIPFKISDSHARLR